MNPQINIQTLNIDVHAYKLRKVFDDYGIITSYPINREQFVKDVLKSVTSDAVYVFDSFGNFIPTESQN